MIFSIFDRIFLLEGLHFETSHTIPVHECLSKSSRLDQNSAWPILSIEIVLSTLQSTYHRRTFNFEPLLYMALLQKFSRTYNYAFFNKSRMFSSADLLNGALSTRTSLQETVPNFLCEFTARCNPRRLSLVSWLTLFQIFTSISNINLVPVCHSWRHKQRRE